MAMCMTQSISFILYMLQYLGYCFFATHHHIFYSEVHDTGYDTPTMATLRLVVMGVSSGIMHAN